MATRQHNEANNPEGAKMNHASYIEESDTTIIYVNEPMIGEGVLVVRGKTTHDEMMELGFDYDRILSNVNELGE
jgi:hypothetical protein